MRWPWQRKGMQREDTQKAATVFGPNDMWMQGKITLAEYPTRGTNMNDAYERSTAVYACIRRQALDVASLPLLYLRDPLDMNSEAPENNELAALVERPNPWYSREQFVQYIVTMLLMRGEVFVLADDPRRPRELYPFFDPLYWHEQVDRNGRLSGWVYRQGKVQIVIPAHDNVLHHRLIGLKNPWRGQSPLQAALSSYATEVDADKLSATTMAQGGDKGTLYRLPADADLSPEQIEQVMAELRARITKDGSVPRPAVLKYGMDVVNPKMTTSDLDILKHQDASVQRICQAYGMSPGLIGRDDSANYVETFAKRQTIYWKQTLIPLIRGFESAFDKWFTPRFGGLYMRFDLSQVESLQADLRAQAETAEILLRNGVPWRVVEGVIGTGLEIDKIPGADEGWLPSGMAPVNHLLNTWSVDDEPTEDKARGAMGKAAQQHLEPATSPRAAAENEAIRKAAADPRAVISRQRRLLKLESTARNVWRKQIGTAKLEARKIVRHSTAGATLRDARPEIEQKLLALRDQTGESVAEAYRPIHTKAAAEGQLSIAILQRRVAIDDAETWHQKAVLSEASREIIKKRQNRIRDATARFFDELLATVSQVIVDGGTEVGEVMALVSDAFNVELNRASMIARTEVGSAYNASRTSEMTEQGFTHHEWIANVDEVTRDSHLASQDQGPVKIGIEKFVCGLYYPMEDGGPPEEVINCRCETIPVVSEE